MCLATASSLLQCSGNVLQASEMASATLSSTQLTATMFQYNMDLTDIGTTNIGTFWFSWVPGQGFMASAPISLSAPVNWVSAQTDGPPPIDGYSIQWVAGVGAALTPGQSLSGFTFTSTLTPQELAGASTIHPGMPVLTSSAYAAAPLSDPGFQFVVSEAAGTATLSLSHARAARNWAELLRLRPPQAYSVTSVTSLPGSSTVPRSCKPCRLSSQRLPCERL